MTNSQLTREKVQWLHDAAEEAAAVGIKLTMNPSELLMFTSSLLAAMDSEPVAEVVSVFGDSESIGERELKLLVGIQNMPYGTKFYRHAQTAPERDQVRREHAEWSKTTFGNVGPIGPLKHLRREVLEAIAKPDDLIEWADMYFLLWDAQRRAGITDEQITLAMIEKLAVNKLREWPAPKDGEPRLHIKEQPAPVAEREPIAWLNDAYLARGVVDGEAGSEDAGPGYIPVYREAGPQPATVTQQEQMFGIGSIFKPQRVSEGADCDDCVHYQPQICHGEGCPAISEKPAQPAPVVTFYRDGIEAAAKWVDQQRESYDSEHGQHDTGTGFFEFGNDAQREYSSTLEELAEGIRALHPNAGNSPVIPDGYVMVPKEPTEAMMLHKSGCQHHAWDDPDCAMRQTRRLIWSHMLASAPTGIPMNSNAWIPVSERMPPSRHEVLVGRWWGEEPRWCRKWATYIPGHPDAQQSGWLIPGASWVPTHWQELPAAPQEVKPWSSHYLPVTCGDAVGCPFKREVQGE